MQPERAPRRIVEPDGHVHVGWFDAPIDEPNLVAAPARHWLSRLRGTPLGLIERGYRRMRLKEWLYVSVVSERAFFACAVVNAGYLGSAFVYVVERESLRRHEWSTLVPLGIGVQVAPSSTAGETRLERAGWGRITMVGTRRVKLELERPALEAEYILEGDLDPVVVVEESEPARWLYTHKCYGLRASGRLRTTDFSDETDHGLAGFDYNRGFRPRETWWHWAAAAGHAVGGATIAFNLTAHRHFDAPRGGAPDALDCALWLDGERVKIDRVEFESRPEAPWRISDADKAVDLAFYPLGERSENIRLGVLESRFAQPYGRFEGSLRSPSGRRFELDDVFGVTERHYARW